MTPGPHSKDSFQTGTKTFPSLAAPPGSPAKRPTQHLFMLYYHHFNPIAPLLKDNLFVSWVHKTQKMHLVKKNNKAATRYFIEMSMVIVFMLFCTAVPIVVTWGVSSYSNYTFGTITFLYVVFL